MKPITCIAIDDEPLALLIIEQFCQRRGDMEVATFCECQQGLAQIKETRPDIVFLDVEMNDVSGLEIAEELPQGTCLIFTTAHSQYALDGFNLDAVDFLFKPFSYERFLQAVSKAERRIESMDNRKLSESITVVQEYNKVSIPLSDIIYMEAWGNYCKIFRASGEMILAHTNLKSLQNMLPEEYFLRIHRSFIISTQYIEGYTTSKVRMAKEGTEIPIGYQYQKTFKQKMGQ